eukprot:5590537-Alexandrium_andersonii.AAC.1
MCIRDRPREAVQGAQSTGWFLGSSVIRSCLRERSKLAGFPKGGAGGGAGGGFEKASQCPKRPSKEPSSMDHVRFKVTWMLPVGRAHSKLPVSPKGGAAGGAGEASRRPRGARRGRPRSSASEH